MKKLILGCLLALFASGCNDNEPEQKPVELKISFAGENPVEFTVGEQKRLAFTVTGDDLEGLTFAAEPDEALSGWTVVVSAGREGDAYAGALDVTASATPSETAVTLTVTDRNGMPRMVRTTRFAEAEIEWRGERWLAAMPLTPAALPRIERTASVLRRMNTEHLTQFRILPEEMRWTDALGNERRTGLVLQQLPGREFAEALLTEDKTVLLAALDTLREALRELEFTHNNLRESNLRWHRGRIIPIRYYDARIGAAENGGADAEAFEALKRRIAEAPMPRQSVNDVEAVYNPVRKLTGHRWTSHVFEGLVCVEDEGGFGFVDTDNNPVIPSQFLWAGDFHEGRAEVQTRTGMGLIDREGGYVIPPEYEIVDYDPAVSIVHVRHGGRWALFDYLGRRLTEFGREDMQEPVRQEPCRSEICR